MTTIKTGAATVNPNIAAPAQSAAPAIMLAPTPVRLADWLFAEAIAKSVQFGIDPTERTHLKAADLAITDALSNSSHMQRLAKTTTAVNEVQAAQTALGSGLTFTVGQGSLMF